MGKKVILILTVMMAALGCQKKESTSAGQTAKSNTITLKLLKVIEGFNIPECFVVDKSTGNVYVSNVATSEEGYWDDDFHGFSTALCDHKALSIRIMFDS